MLGLKKKDKKEEAPKAQKAETKAQDSQKEAAPAAEEAKPLTPKQEIEMRREAKEKARHAAQQKLADLHKQKVERQKLHAQKMKKKQQRTLWTFCLGLLVMLTALIAIFPSPIMIVFSTLLMFSFFFLGIAYQRIIMQLLVVAMACVIITGAFYMIISTQ